QIQCCVCLETYGAPSIVSLACHHPYCFGCLKELFIRATKDETLFPPRCCRQRIDAALIKEEFTHEELYAFRVAFKKFTTADRTYCSKADCGSFIPPDRIVANKAVCTRCKRSTCKMCRSAFHQGKVCPEDPTIQATLSLADSKGWKRCHSCGHLVELAHGCNHITCKCGSAFCYTCGKQWKTCHC
ncbi:hypothetical protein K458DRAFT_264205, partial [Lentithecium fluviatile CBS 122367]